MKKIKKFDVACVNSLLQGAKMTKGDTAAKMALINAIVSTKEEAEKYLDFEKTTFKTMEGENHTEMEVLKEKVPLTAEEFLTVTKYFNKYKASVNEALTPEKSKPVSVDLKPWTQEQLEALFGSNDFTGEQMVLLQKVLLEEKKPETDKKA